MAHVVIRKETFVVKDDTGTSRNLNIELLQKNGTLDTSTPLGIISDVVIKKGSSNNDPYQVINPSQLQLKIRDESGILDLFRGSTDKREFKIIVTFDGVVEFVGFVLLRTKKQTFYKGKEELQLKAFDGLGLLKEVDYFSQASTLKGWLQDVVDAIGLENGPFIVRSSWDSNEAQNSDGKTFPLGYEFDPSHIGRNIDDPTWADQFEQFCDTFGLQAYQDKGRFYLSERADRVRNSTSITQEVDLLDDSVRTGFDITVNLDGSNSIQYPTGEIVEALKRIKYKTIQGGGVLRNVKLLADPDDATNILNWESTNVERIQRTGDEAQSSDQIVSFDFTTQSPYAEPTFPNGSLVQETLVTFNTEKPNELTPILDQPDIDRLKITYTLGGTTDGEKFAGDDKFIKLDVLRVRGRPLGLNGSVLPISKQGIGLATDSRQEPGPFNVLEGFGFPELPTLSEYVDLSNTSAGSFQATIEAENPDADPEDQRPPQEFTQSYEMVVTGVYDGSFTIQDFYYLEFGLIPRYNDDLGGDKGRLRSLFIKNFRVEVLNAKGTGIIRNTVDTGQVGEIREYETTLDAGNRTANKFTYLYNDGVNVDVVTGFTSASGKGTFFFPGSSLASTVAYDRGAMRSRDLEKLKVKTRYVTGVDWGDVINFDVNDNGNIVKFTPLQITKKLISGFTELTAVEAIYEDSNLTESGALGEEDESDNDTVGGGNFGGNTGTGGRNDGDSTGTNVGGTFSNISRYVNENSQRIQFIKRVDLAGGANVSLVDSIKYRDPAVFSRSVDRRLASRTPAVPGNWLIYYGFPNSYRSDVLGFVNADIIAEISAQYDAWTVGDSYQRNISVQNPITESNGTATLTTVGVGHQHVVGETFLLTGCDVPAYNTTHVVTGVTDEFTLEFDQPDGAGAGTTGADIRLRHQGYPNTQAIMAGVANAGVELSGYINLGLSQFGQGIHTLDELIKASQDWIDLGCDVIFIDEAGMDFSYPGGSTPITPSAISYDSGTGRVTVTTPSAHPLRDGMWMNIRGNAESGVNGSYQVTNTGNTYQDLVNQTNSSTTFEYTPDSPPGGSLSVGSTETSMDYRERQRQIKSGIENIDPNVRVCWNSFQVGWIAGITQSQVETVYPQGSFNAEVFKNGNPLEKDLNINADDIYCFENHVYQGFQSGGASDAGFSGKFTTNERVEQLREGFGVTMQNFALGVLSEDPSGVIDYSVISPFTTPQEVALFGWSNMMALGMEWAGIHGQNFGASGTNVIQVPRVNFDRQVWQERSSTPDIPSDFVTLNRNLDGIQVSNSLDKGVTIDWSFNGSQDYVDRGNYLEPAIEGVFVSTIEVTDFTVRSGGSALINPELETAGGIRNSGGNWVMDTGYFWNKNGVSYLAGGAIVGSSAVPVYDFEVEGNSHLKTGWLWVEDNYILAGNRIGVGNAPYGPNRIGNSEVQVDGSVDVTGSIGFIYDTATQQSSWRMFQGGNIPLLIVKNFQSSFAVVDIKGLGTDPSDQTKNSEATLALFRGTSDEQDSEFIDFFNNGYWNEGVSLDPSIYMGIRIQKRGVGEYRPWRFQYSDGVELIEMWEVNPPDDGNNVNWFIESVFYEDLLPNESNQPAGEGVDIGSVNARFRSLWARELQITRLVTQEEVLSMGGRILVSVGNTELAEDLSDTDFNGFFVSNGVEYRDMIKLEARGLVEWIVVDNEDIVSNTQDSITISSDVTADYEVENDIYLSGSTADVSNDGQYTVQSVSYDSGNNQTTIGVTPPLEGPEPGTTFGVTWIKKNDERYLYRSLFRDQDGTGANNWLADDGVFNTGKPGDEVMDLHAKNTLMESATAETGSGSTVWVRTGSAYDQMEIRFSAGNLNSKYGLGTNDIYGMGAGDRDATYILVDAGDGGSRTAGVRILDGANGDKEMLFAGSNILRVGSDFAYNGLSGTLVIGSGFTYTENDGRLVINGSANIASWEITSSNLENFTLDTPVLIGEDLFLGTSRVLMGGISSGGTNTSAGFYVANANNDYLIMWNDPNDYAFFRAQSGDNANTYFIAGADPSSSVGAGNYGVHLEVEGEVILEAGWDPSLNGGAGGGFATLAGFTITGDRITSTDGAFIIDSSVGIFFQVDDTPGQLQRINWESENDETNSAQVYAVLVNTDEMQMVYTAREHILTGQNGLEVIKVRGYDVGGFGTSQAIVNADQTFIKKLEFSATSGDQLYKGDVQLAGGGTATAVLIV